MNRESVGLVTDSTAGIHALDPAAPWHVVPLELEIDGRRVREAEGFSAAEFHRLIQEVNTVPVTLPPSVETFAAFYEPLLASHRWLLSLHLSGALSGTVANARAAARALGAEERIAVMDSRLAGLALGLLCLEAEARLAAGLDFGALRADLESIISAARVYFSVYTLDFLYLSGRLERGPSEGSSGAARVVNGVEAAADDRPILRLQDGRLSVVERVVGETTRVHRIAELLQAEYAPEERLVAACVHAGPRGAEAAERLEKRMTESRPSRTAWYRAPLGPVICAHTGFDVCGIAVYPGSLSRLPGD